jgi:hypothetical protein
MMKEAVELGIPNPIQCQPDRGKRETSDDDPSLRPSNGILSVMGMLGQTTAVGF